jgi:hypothetical protein
MNTNLKKFSLYIEIDGVVDYSILPKSDDILKNDNEVIYSCLLDINKSNTVKIKLDNQKTVGAKIKIKRITLNNIEVNITESFGMFINHKKEKRIGSSFITEPGEFLIRLHGNVISHNFLNYIVSLTKKST